MSDSVGIYRQIWLALMREGGYHSIPEVRELIAPVQHRDLHTLLRQMARQGYIIRRRGDDNVYRHGVTLSCTLPHFLTVAQVLDASNDAGRKAA